MLLFSRSASNIEPLRINEAVGAAEMLLSMRTGSAAPPEPDGPSRLLSHERTVGKFDKTFRGLELYQEYLGAQIECLAN